MRILILGAGATGGYYGGRLIEAGADVTFLVRPRRAAQLRKTGLLVKSQYGDIAATPKLIESVSEPFDLIIISCKAFDLDSSIEAIKPAVAKHSAVLPLLNGMRHIDDLLHQFGDENVLGGLCQISSTLNEDGEIIHLNDQHFLKFGELKGVMSPRIEELSTLAAGAKMAANASTTILHDMWDKWMRLATLAGITSLMRSSVGDIARSQGGQEIAMQLFNECLSIGTAYGYGARGQFIEQTHSMLTDTSSTLMASMLRDIEKGNKVEGDHILGDLISRAERKSIPVPILRVAYCHVKAYEHRRDRQARAN